MSRRIRLEAWLLAMDVTAAIDRALHRPWSLRLYLWAVERAGDATGWGRGAERGEEAPW